MRRSRGGFTLIELAIVLAIVAIVAAVGIPNLIQSNRRAQLDARTRELIGAIALAQSEAVTGRELTGVVGGVAGRALQAGIRFDSEDRYTVFVDNDNDPTAVEVVQIGDLLGGGGGGLTSSGSGIDVTIETVTVGGATESPPAGIEFRFRNDATIVNSNNVVINLIDQDFNRRNIIQVSVAGQVTITEERI